jgi:hypothetical protein
MMTRSGGGLWPQARDAVVLIWDSSSLLPWQVGAGQPARRTSHIHQPVVRRLARPARLAAQRASQRGRPSRPRRLPFAALTRPYPSGGGVLRPRVRAGQPAANPASSPARHPPVGSPGLSSAEGEPARQALSAAAPALRRADPPLPTRGWRPSAARTGGSTGRSVPHLFTDPSFAGWLARPVQHRGRASAAGSICPGAFPSLR